MRSSRNTLEGAARLAGRSGAGLGEISDAALVLWLDPRRKQPNRVLILQHRQSANRQAVARSICLSAGPRAGYIRGALPHRYVRSRRAGKRGREWSEGGQDIRDHHAVSRYPMAVISRQQPAPCVLLYLSIPLWPFHGLPLVPANARALRETRFNLARLTILSNLSRRRHA